MNILKGGKHTSHCAPRVDSQERYLFVQDTFLFIL